MGRLISDHHLVCNTGIEQFPLCGKGVKHISACLWTHLGGRQPKAYLILIILCGGQGHMLIKVIGFKYHRQINLTEK